MLNTKYELMSSDSNGHVINSVTGESYQDYCNTTNQMQIEWGSNVWDYLMNQLNNWVDTASMHYRNEEYYRNICIELGKILGPDVYVCDDGSISDDVLIDKLIEVAKSKLLNP